MNFDIAHDHLMNNAWASPEMLRRCGYVEAESHAGRARAGLDDLNCHVEHGACNHCVLPEGDRRCGCVEAEKHPRHLLIIVTAACREKGLLLLV